MLVVEVSVREVGLGSRRKGGERTKDVELAQTQADLLAFLPSFFFFSLLSAGRLYRGLVPPLMLEAPKRALKCEFSRVCERKLTLLRLSLKLDLRRPTTVD